MWNIKHFLMWNIKHFSQGFFPAVSWFGKFLRSSYLVVVTAKNPPIFEMTLIILTFFFDQDIDVSKEYLERQAGKELLNMVVIGHVDAGKSTLMGHLLYLLGQVNKKQMHKYETESKKQGKASFAYAWVLDETGEERER